MASWAELFVLQTGSAMSFGDIRQAARREAVASDVAVEGAWALIEDRRQLHGERWPLTLSDGVLERSDRVSEHILKFHAFLCGLSIGGEVALADRRLFEHCVTDLAPAFSGGPAIRLGSPRVAPVPVGFDEACSYYGDVSNVPHVTIRAYPHDQDLGLDVATWMEFGDKRGDYLHFIGQCATGANWDDKLDDPIVLRWRDRIQWASDPVRFFAIPFVIRAEDWRRVCQATGLVLDRPRLVELAYRTTFQDDRLDALAGYLEQFS